MEKGFYEIDIAGIESFDIFVKTGLTNGWHVGIIAKRKDGTWRHYYNSNATKGSQRKFTTFDEALENLHNRRMKRKAKRAGA